MPPPPPADPPATATPPPAIEHGRPCPQCGIRNPEKAQFCWQCYRPFAQPGAPGGGFMGQRMQPVSLRQAGYGTPFGSVLQPALEDTPVRRGSGGPKLALSKNVIAGVVVAVVVAAIGGRFGWAKLHQTHLQVPPAVAGMQRIDTPDVAQLVANLEKIASDNGTEGKAAVYGYDGVPQVLFFAAVDHRVEDPHTPDDLFVAFSNGFASSGPQSVNLNTKQTDMVEETTFICARVRGQPTGSLCMWRDDEVVGFVLGIGQSLDATHSLTAAVRSSVES